MFVELEWKRIIIYFATNYLFSKIRTYYNDFCNLVQIKGYQPENIYSNKIKNLLTSFPTLPQVLSPGGKFGLTIR